MKPAKFAYAKPTTLGEVLTLLHEHRDDAAILSGGQTLVPMLNLRVAAPQLLIDINAVPDLDTITASDSTLSIGARARHNKVLRSELVQQSIPLLGQALRHVAHEAVRNRGTLGGSLALADPAAEMPACMVCLGAEIILCSNDGTRSVPASDFFQGIYDTDRQPNELIARVEIPIPDASWRFAFHEISRRHGDFAMAGLFFGIRCQEGAVTDCRVVFMGIETFPRRIAEVESAIVGVELSNTTAINQAVALLSTALECEDGEEYPAAYRLYLAKQLLSHCAAKAFSEFTHG